MTDTGVAFMVGGILGAAIGISFTKAKVDGDLDAARAELAKVRAELAETDADRDRWKRLANKLADETEKQQALIAPIFRIPRGH